MEFLAWLEQLRFSQWVVGSGSIWAYPTILTVHTAGMMMVAGVTAVISLRLLGVAAAIRLKPLEALYPLAWWAFGINALTGTILLMADATTKLTNPDFYVKMAFIAVGVVVLRLIRTKVFGDPGLDTKPVSQTGKILAWLAIFSWTGAITAGRLLAYLGPVSGGIKGQINR